MRRFFVGDVEVFQGAPFDAGGFAHAANWASAYTPDDMARFGITYKDEPESLPVPPVVYVSTYRIVKRLEAAGKLEVANAALEQNLAARAKFYTVGTIRADDPEANALLKAIGVDPAEILATEIV